MIKEYWGSTLLIIGSIAVGRRLVHDYKKQFKMLQQISHMISNIVCDLEYHMTPLPQLIRNETVSLCPLLKRVFITFAEALESQISPNVMCCLDNTLAQYSDIHGTLKGILVELGNALGRFDLTGQLKCLQAVQLVCEKELDILAQGQAGYVKCCRAYCLCAGVLASLILL